ncbi:MAG: alpha/beta hydrolase, partial [Chromatiales bacterium]|nr:alpha/beta hydrolase [Chromatiales bacterium]
SYPLFDRQMFWDYCRYGLLPTANGDFVLACPPEVEAAVYVAARTNGAVFESVRSLEIPVLILRAKESPKVRQPMDFASSPTWPQLVNEFAHGREIHLPQYTHFIPLQAPERVIAVIQDEVSAWRVAKGL